MKDIIPTKSTLSQPSPVDYETQKIFVFSITVTIHLFFRPGNTKSAGDINPGAENA